jgi:mannose-6-phosphate isomerase-like protein (cupin superfamily)
MPAIYYADARQQVRYTPQGAQPQYVLDGDCAKVLLGGLEPGQSIPAHPELLALYTILEGEGSMQVGEDRFPIGPGTLVVVPAGMARGMVAETRLAFVAARFGQSHREENESC